MFLENNSSWMDKCCLPQDRGGLGLRRAYYQNQAFLMEKYRVLRSKYKLEEDCLVNIDRRCDNSTWKSISKVLMDVCDSIF